MSIFYLVQSRDVSGNKFIYETLASDEGVGVSDLVNDILTGQYDVLLHITRLDTDRDEATDVTVQVAEAVREEIVAGRKTPIPAVREWINWVGIDPIEVRDGH